MAWSERTISEENREGVRAMNVNWSLFELCPFSFPVKSSFSLVLCHRNISARARGLSSARGVSRVLNLPCRGCVFVGNIRVPDSVTPPFYFGKLRSTAGEKKTPFKHMLQSNLFLFTVIACTCRVNALATRAAPSASTAIYWQYILHQGPSDFRHAAKCPNINQYVFTGIS